ncbi:MAG: hypothetical protein M1483_05810 [Actinobacteria bacterium]|nr:hypothetical protein [Actinomycetota bacterium]
MRFKYLLSTKLWIIFAVLVLIATGMLYSLEWGSWILNKPSYGWTTPGDLWGIVHSVKDVTSGYFGHIYRDGNGIVTFPAILLILAPAVLLNTRLGGSFTTRLLVHPLPHLNPRPDAWLIIGPYEMLIGSLPLFALDALAKRLGISTARRVVLTFLEMAALWPLLVIWGHPEDALAVGIGLYGLMAAYDKRYVKAGWLFGIAISIQPLVGLIFPIIFGLTEKRHWLSLGIRGVLPSFALLVVPIISSPRSTLTSILQQPSYPLADHPTPWVYLSPKITFNTGYSRAVPTQLHITGHLPLVVSAGPTRIFAIIAAFTIGYWILRHHPGLILVLWLAGLSFAARCFFESVMVPYYFWPAIAISLLIASKGSWAKFISVVLFAGALTVFSYWRMTPWIYWSSMMLLLIATLGFAIPTSDNKVEAIVKLES